MRKPRPPVTPETRKKLSDALKGRVRSPEHCESIRKSRTGRKHTQATKQKCREANLGKKLSEETKKRMSQLRLAEAAERRGPQFEHAIAQAYKYYCAGNTLRTTADRFNFKRSTLRRWLVHYFGKDYKSKRNKTGMFLILKEYIKSPKIKADKRQQINDWLEQNRQHIYELEQESDIHLLTEATMVWKTQRECRYEKDLRDWI